MCISSGMHSLALFIYLHFLSVLHASSLLNVLMVYHPQVYTKEWAEILNNRSRHIEDAVQELISIFEQIYEVKRTKKSLKKFPTQGIYPCVTIINSPIVSSASLAEHSGADATAAVSCRLASEHDYIFIIYSYS